MDALELFALTVAIAPLIRAERPERVPTPLGELPVEYLRDEDADADYALVRLGLPAGVYAEIDSETFGSLAGIRIYLDD